MLYQPLAGWGVVGRTEVAEQSVQVKALEVWMCTARANVSFTPVLWVHPAAEDFWCGMKHLWFGGQRWEYMQMVCSKGRKLTARTCCLWARRSSTSLPLAWCSLTAVVYMAINIWDIPIMNWSNSRVWSHWGKEPSLLRLGPNWSVLGGFRTSKKPHVGRAKEPLLGKVQVCLRVHRWRTREIGFLSSERSIHLQSPLL